jgi:NAD(P)-dependent dehydrogenase (short-subunit alcohol dehydrogenase family)
MIQYINHGQLAPYQVIAYVKKTCTRLSYSNIIKSTSKEKIQLITMSAFGFHTTGDQVVSALADKVNGRTFVITGATVNGLGANAAIALAQKSPAHIVLVSRNKSKVDPVLAEIASAAPDVKTTFIPCDLADLDSVREAADAINNDAAITKIDILLNNAGVMAILKHTFDKRGNEYTLSANHLGHFVLTNLLLPKIIKAGPKARIVNMSSKGHLVSPFRFDDYNFTSKPNGDSYDGWTAYGQSKTANVLFSVALTKKLAKYGIESFSVHPGSIYTTNLAAHLEESAFAVINDISRRNTGHEFEIDPPKTPEEGISTMLVASLDPSLSGKGGSYLANCQIAESRDYAVDPQLAEKLWTLSEQLVGQKFEL